jgi:mutator protein MutT
MSSEHTARPATDHGPRATDNQIDVAAGLIFRNGRLLITQRPADGHLAGLWEFPGGKREPGESFETCLIRELREELDVEVEIQDLIESIDHDYPEKSVHLRFFRCRLTQGEPKTIGCPDLRWIQHQELTDFDFPAADAVLIENLQARPDLWASPSLGEWGMSE